MHQLGRLSFQLVDSSGIVAISGNSGYGNVVFIEIANALYVSADELLKDNLDNTLVVSNHDFAELLTDCTVLERKAMLLAASTAKEFVRENRGAMRSGRY